MSSDGAVAERLKVPKPLPSGISWERTTSEKKMESLLKSKDITLGSSPWDEKGAIVHVRAKFCCNVITR